MWPLPTLKPEQPLMIQSFNIIVLQLVFSDYTFTEKAQKMLFAITRKLPLRAVLRINLFAQTTIRTIFDHSLKRRIHPEMINQELAKPSQTGCPDLPESVWFY